MSPARINVSEKRLTENKCFESRPLTRINWNYGPPRKAREFFGELRNFADLMPGIEGIRKEAAASCVGWFVRKCRLSARFMRLLRWKKRRFSGTSRVVTGPLRNEKLPALRGAFEERGTKF
jgi:hypothetical protein